MSKEPKHTRRDYYQDLDAPDPTTRKPSASTVVRDATGRILIFRRTDNNLWTIPTGGLKKNETIRQCAVRECREETGIEIDVTTLIGVFSDPAHIIAYYHGKKLHEVRQPVNICLHGHPIGGTLSSGPDGAHEVRWIDPASLAHLNIHPAIRRRISHALSGDPRPQID